MWHDSGVQLCIQTTGLKEDYATVNSTPLFRLVERHSKSAAILHNGTETFLSARPRKIPLHHSKRLLQECSRHRRWTCQMIIFWNIPVDLKYESSSDYPEKVKGAPINPDAPLPPLWSCWLLLPDLLYSENGNRSWDPFPSAERKQTGRLVILCPKRPSLDSNSMFIEVAENHTPPRKGSRSRTLSRDRPWLPPAPEVQHDNTPSHLMLQNYVLQVPQFTLSTQEHGPRSEWEPKRSVLDVPSVPVTFTSTEWLTEDDWVAQQHMLQDATHSQIGWTVGMLHHSASGLQ